MVKGQMNFLNINFQFRVSLVPVLVFHTFKLHHMSSVRERDLPP